MKRQYVILGLLILLLIVLSAVFSSIYNSKFKNSYTSLDPDTDQTITVNGVSSGENVTKTFVYGIEPLQQKGLSENQTSKLSDELIKVIDSKFSNNYKSISINAESVMFDSSTKTYSFKARLGDIESKVYIFIDVVVPTQKQLKVTIKDSSSKVINESTINI